MGIHMALQTYPMVTIIADSTGNCKQGDHGWGPIRPPPGRSRKWPTVVLEGASSASESESRVKLQSEVRFWLHESQGDVKIVLTLAINREKPEIVIEKWELNDNRPHRTRQVTVYMGENNQTIIHDAPLVIEFDKLLLREIAIPKEKDIELDENALKDVAALIWLVQEFLDA